MNRYPIWKYVIIVIMLLLGTIYSLPNLYGEAPAVQVSPGKATVKLDNASLSKVESLLQAEGLQAGMIQMEGHSIKARFDDTTAQLKARDVLVNGRHVVRDFEHSQQARIAARFRAALAKLSK